MSTCAYIQWPPSLDPWLPFTPITHATMSQLNGACLFMLNVGSKEQYSLAQQITQTLGGSLATTLQDATHALWVESHEEDYTQNIECSLAKSLSIPIVDANRWLGRISNLQRHEHWSEINCDEYTPQVRKRDMFLAESLSQTLKILSMEDPDFAEANALKRAMELSMLDSALVIRSASLPAYSNQNQSAHEILGLQPDASFAEIKKAYRRLARVHHPDKGGSAEVFERISRAYRSLIVTSSSSSSYSEKGVTALKGTAHWDSEIKDHHRLVQELFTSHGANLTQNVAAQVEVLDALGLEAQDVGSTNINEKHETIHNSCFYLSLATSYLLGIGAMDDLKEDMYLMQQAALQFKRLIEASVVVAHPEWAASGQVGEHVQAFSDFLVYLLDSPDTLISDWAVAVFDTTSGLCDIYKGKFYDKLNDEGKASNTITIQYLPGHYQPLVLSNNHRDGNRPNLDQIIHTLDIFKVLYVVTDGSA
jgi:hypothetical protein